MEALEAARNEPLVVLGVDPGTRLMGWGVLGRRTGELLHVDHGELKAPRTDEIPRRLLRLSEGLTAVLDHHRPQVVALEQAFFGRNAQSALRLGEARGVVLVEAARRDLPVLQLPASTAKKAVLGDGRSPKAAVREMLQRRLGVDLSDASEDASDALALALAALVDPRLDPRLLPGR